LLERILWFYFDKFKVGKILFFFSNILIDLKFIEA